MAGRTYRFTFGPWNISTGADPFGPAVRKELELLDQVLVGLKMLPDDLALARTPDLQGLGAALRS